MLLSELLLEVLKIKLICFLDREKILLSTPQREGNENFHHFPSTIYAAPAKLKTRKANPG